MRPVTVDVAIVGAGTSGCFIASLLHEAGFNCILIEKSRGLGGRCSRRRVSENGYSVDLGAAEFSTNNIESEYLRKKLTEWIDSGWLHSWQRQSSRFNASEQGRTIEALCATPSMNAWHKKIAGHINILTNCKVQSLKKAEAHWCLLDESGQIISLAHKVIVTSPAEQAFELLQSIKGSDYGQSISTKSLPQYVCAVGFAQPLNVNADVLRGGNSVLALASRDNRTSDSVMPKPLREIWVLHSTHKWARGYSAAEHQQAAIAMTQEFCNLFDEEVEPHILTSHYWRLARHEIGAEQTPNFIWDDKLQVGCCGDWLDSGDIGGALNSSLALFEKITQTKTLGLAMKNKNIISTDKQEVHVAEHDKENASIMVGLSACLAGHEVRYNGGHTQSRLCLDVLSRHFSFKTFCPEVAAGFGTPRPTMRLIGDPEQPKLVFSNAAEDGPDLSPQLTRGFEHKLAEMNNLNGYILMKNSPSCGMERVKVYQPNGYPHTTPGMGVFAKALKEKYPLMPIEEEGRLNDDALYDNFVMRVYAYHNFQREVLHQPSLRKLIDFHATYKYVLMSHNQKQYKNLGRLVACHKKIALDELINSYFENFMQALAKPASRKNHANTLMHILGYLKKSVPSSARQHIVGVIDKYKAGITPLETPLTLLTHYLGQYGSNYINSQRYLMPYPENIHPIRKYCR